MSSDSNGDGSSASSSEDDFLASDDDESDGNESYHPGNVEDDGEDAGMARRRTRGAARACSARTNERMAGVIREENKSEKEALGESVPDVDQDYLHDTPSDSDDEDEKKRKSSLPPRPRKPKRRRRVEVNTNSDWEDLVDSSENEEEYGEMQGDHYPNGRKRKANTRRSLKAEFDEEARPEDEDEENEFDDGNCKGLARNNDIAPTYFQAKHPRSPSKPMKLNCPSTKDSYTRKDLPRGKPHICCMGGDGERLCYTLETLQRIASEKYINRSISTLQYLQPPNFVAQMDGDVLDQIACRCGRNALKIEESSVYKQMTKCSTLMGTSDLYSCPICYSEAYKRQGNLAGTMAIDDDSAGDESDSDSRESDGDPFLFNDDPMTILQNASPETASTFCFLKLAELKSHIKNVHGLDPSEMKGNDLFHRFRIRGSDGLLQHWTTSMSVYWNYWADDRYKNSKAFIALLKLVQKRQSRIGQRGANDLSFSKSFPNRARNYWYKLSKPFLRHGDSDESDCQSTLSRPDSGNDDLIESDSDNDVIIQSDSDNDDSTLSDSDNEMIRHLKEKYGQNEEESMSNDDEQHSSSNSEDECTSCEGEEQEEQSEDGWMKRKRQRPTAARLKSRNRESDNEDSDDDFFGKGSNIVSPSSIRKTQSSPHPDLEKDDDADNTSADEDEDAAGENQGGHGDGDEAGNSDSEEEQVGVQVEAPNANTLMGFGRYSDETYGYVAQHYPGYVTWARLQDDDPPDELFEFVEWLNSDEGRSLIRWRPSRF